MKVSVIIPSYNSAQFLNRTLSSVLDQTEQDFEILIIDDASDDNTAQLLDMWSARDARIRTFQLEENSGGAAKPKNVGLAHARGEFIAVLDSDDEWMPTKLEKQLALFAAGPDLGFVGCNTLIVETNGMEKKTRLVQMLDVLSRILQSDYMGPGSSTMYRKEVFDEVGGFDEVLRSGQDWDMRIRLAQTHPFAFVDGSPLVRYHQHGGNISKMDVDRRDLDLQYIERKHQELYLARPKIYSRKLRFDGTRYMLAGAGARARSAFLRSLRYDPFNGLTYVYLVLSLLGTRVYRTLTQLKRAHRARGL